MPHDDVGGRCWGCGGPGARENHGGTGPTRRSVRAVCLPRQAARRTSCAEKWPPVGGDKKITHGVEPRRSSGCHGFPLFFEDPDPVLDFKAMITRFK